MAPGQVADGLSHAVAWAVLGPICPALRLDARLQRDCHCKQCLHIHDHDGRAKQDRLLL